MSMTKSTLFQDIKSSCREPLAAEGFRELPDSYRRDVDEVNHFVGFTIAPRRIDEPYEISIEFCVYSARFAEVTRSVRNGLSWLDSQIRASIVHLLPSASPLIKICNEAERDRLLDSLPHWISEYGLPFLSKFSTTDDIVEFTDSCWHEHRSMFVKNKDRADWEIGVWRGEIDPESQPWKPVITGPIHTTVEDFLDMLKESGGIIE